MIKSIWESGEIERKIIIDLFNRKVFNYILAVADWGESDLAGKCRGKGAKKNHAQTGNLE